MPITRYTRLRDDIDLSMMTSDDYALYELDIEKYMREKLDELWWADPLNHSELTEYFLEASTQGEAREIAEKIYQESYDTTIQEIVNHAEKELQVALDSTGEHRRALIFTSETSSEKPVNDMMQLWRESRDLSEYDDMWSADEDPI